MANDFERDVVNRIGKLEKIIEKLSLIEQAPKGFDVWANRPASPFAGQRFFATDRGLEYTWNGTQWTTIQLFTGTFNGVLPPVTTTVYDKSSVTISSLATNAGSNIIPRSFDMGFYVTSGNFDVSNYWQVRIFIGFVSNSGQQLLLQSLWQTGRATGIIYPFSANLGTTTYTNNYTIFRLSFIAIGNPGPLEFNGPTITYQASV